MLWSDALPLSRISRFLPALAILALTLLFFYRLAFTDLILARGDTFAYFYPYWHARNAALMAGQLPLWTPDLFMGVPLLANSQLGTFYPPNWLVAPLSAPDGVRVSILLHIAWSMAGTYLLARRTLRVSRLAAIVAAAVFAFGGYIGAHVEQINQLQGLSWMPWLFLLLEGAIRVPAWGVPLLAMGLALQFLTGHTQTVFITGVGLSIYALCTRRLRALLAVAGAGLIALILSLPQLLPTMEMTSVSNRRGGLNPNQATAFSFSPFVLGRGLLPSYDRLIFGEYVAYAGVIGLALALIGVFTRSGGHYTPSTTQHRLLQRLRWGVPLSPRLTWLIVGLVGLVLAFGLYNPLYWWLATLPGFNLFRVPARWLALFALAIAMLAALGVQRLSSPDRPRARTLSIITLIIGALVVSSALSLRQPDLTPASLPTLTTLTGWGAALVILLVLVWLRKPKLLTLALMIELLLASNVLPYNDLSAPDVFDTPRFTTNQLLAYQQAEPAPADRLLSISQLLYDPGDRFALENRFAALGMSEEAVQSAFTAIKMQDTLAANLPVLYGLPSADGFDGGLLPTAYYTTFTSLLLPEAELRTIDGRLREILARPEACHGACIPDQRWLNLMNVRYLITDKIHDLWHEDVAYDMTFKNLLSAGDALNFRVVPPFEATALHLLAICADECSSLAVRLTDQTGEMVTLSPSSEQAQLENYTLLRLPFEQPFTPSSVNVAADTSFTLAAATLVDTRTGDFQQLQPESWQRALSSDIELYENGSALPRAFVVYDARFVPDTDLGSEIALDGMRIPSFDPSLSVYISGDGDSPVTSGALIEQNVSANATITAYTPTHVNIRTNAESAAFLVLADAYYPGWTATVNGAPAEVWRADVMFRAVAIPQGEAEVIFEYRPSWLPLALVAGGAAWIITALLLVIRRIYKFP